jgi:hypothetical protein
MMSAGEWSEKQKYPLTAAKVRIYSRLQRAGFREAGIVLVGILGTHCTEDMCAAALAAKDKNFKIAEAPLLPLPGCDKKHCPCILVALG